MEYQRRLEELSNLNLRLRRRWELAEAVLPAANQFIEQLAGMESDLRVTLTGAVLIELPCTCETEAPTSGQVAQAALRYPGGLGVLLWDSEDYLAASQLPDVLAAAEQSTFVPLGQCSKALQGQLLDEALPLLDRFLKIHSPLGGDSCRS